MSIVQGQQAELEELIGNLYRFQLPAVQFFGQKLHLACVKKGYNITSTSTWNIKALPLSFLLMFTHWLSELREGFA